jgi:hypothetical protein
MMYNYRKVQYRTDTVLTVRTCLYSGYQTHITGIKTRAKEFVKNKTLKIIINNENNLPKLYKQT